MREKVKEDEEEVRQGRVDECNPDGRDVRKKGKSGRNIGSATRWRKIWRTSRGGNKKLRSLEEELSVAGFTPNFRLTCQKKREVKLRNSSKKVEQCGRWPQQACTTMSFQIPTNVTRECPIALLLTLIRWWEWLRALEVSRWQERHRVKWDASDKGNGGAERSVWDTLFELERFDHRTGETKAGSDHVGAGQGARTG